MSRVNRIFAVLAVPAAAGVALIIGFSGGASATTGASPTPASLVAGTTATADEKAAYNRLVDKISGTPDQRKLGAELPTAQINHYMTSCMAALPGHFTYRRAYLQAAQFQVGLSDYGLLATPFHYAAGVKAFSEGIQAQNVQPPYDKAAGYDDAIKACETKMPVKQYSQNGRPQSRVASAGTDIARSKATELDSVSLDLDNKIAKLEASPVGKQLMADYNTCLKQYGYAVDGRQQLAGLVWSKFLPLNGLPWNELSTNDQWTAAVKFEQDAAAADTGCRAAADSWAIASLQPVIAFYLTDAHVAELASGWQTIENDARAAGLE